jgi:hypothetical protein
MAILSTNDVIKYAPVLSNYPTANICNVILQIEEDYIYTCFGSKFYDYMAANLTVITSVTDWESGTSYALNAIVERNGCLYKSTAAANTNDPLTGTNWTAVQKFTVACLNTLWNTYLCQILALKTYYHCIVFDTWTAGAKGLTVIEADNNGQRDAKVSEISLIQQNVLRQIDLISANMFRWIRKVKDDGTCVFANIDLCGVDCESPKVGSRRWGLKNTTKNHYY